MQVTSLGFAALFTNLGQTYYLYTIYNLRCLQEPEPQLEMEEEEDSYEDTSMW